MYLGATLIREAADKLWQWNCCMDFIAQMTQLKCFDVVSKVFAGHKCGKKSFESLVLVAPDLNILIEQGFAEFW